MSQKILIDPKSDCINLNKDSKRFLIFGTITLMTQTTQMNQINQRLKTILDTLGTQKDFIISTISVFVLPILINFLFLNENKVTDVQKWRFFTISLYLVSVFYKVYEWASNEKGLRPLNGAKCFLKLVGLVIIWELSFIVLVERSFLATVPTNTFIMVCQIVGFLLSFLAFYDMVPHEPDVEPMYCNNSFITKVRIFFLGRHLIPLIGPMDLKFFWVGRVGMGLWFIVTFRWLIITCVSFTTFSQLFAQMVAFCLSFAYIYDFYCNEQWYTQTIDMIHDRFGFMMAWGSIVWMPFVYSFVMFQIVEYPPDSVMISIFSLIFGLISVLAFRMINNYRVLSRKLLEKGTHCEREISGVLVKSKIDQRETYLITSGPYAYSRHPNYLADLCWCFCLCLTGQTLFSFLFFAFLVILLCNRCLRDEKRCSLKYGSEKWNEYCKIVPYRIIKGVF